MTSRRASAPGLLRMLFLSGVTLVGLAVAGVFAWHYFQDTQAVAAGIERARPWLAVWRALLFAMLIGFWPTLIYWLADRYRWDDTRRAHVTAQRWRVAAWLIVIELVLVQNLVGKFINGLAP